MRKSLFIALVFGVISVTANASEYRLFPGHYLDVGNRWDYTTTLYMLNGQDVDLTGSASISMLGETNISGYVVRHVETSSPWGGRSTFCYMSDDFMLVVGTSDENVKETLRSDDPLEMYPLWVDEDCTNYHFGHGQFDGLLEDPAYTWTRTYDAYITYVGQESVTVPAGTFFCVLVLIKVEYVDSDGQHSVSWEAISVDPHIGLIKQDTYEWVRYADGSEEDSAYYFELTSTNVQPQSYCKVRSVPMDFTGDCRVNLADFAVFLERWMDCELDPPEACWIVN